MPYGPPVTRCTSCISKRIGCRGEKDRKCEGCRFDSDCSRVENATHKRLDDVSTRLSRLEIKIDKLMTWVRSRRVDSSGGQSGCASDSGSGLSESKSCGGRLHNNKNGADTETGEAQTSHTLKVESV